MQCGVIVGSGLGQDWVRTGSRLGVVSTNILCTNKKRGANILDYTVIPIYPTSQAAKIPLPRGKTRGGKGEAMEG